MQKDHKCAKTKHEKMYSLNLPLKSRGQAMEHDSLKNEKDIIKISKKTQMNKIRDEKVLRTLGCVLTDKH